MARIHLYNCTKLFLLVNVIIITFWLTIFSLGLDLKYNSILTHEVKEIVKNVHLNIPGKVNAWSLIVSLSHLAIIAGFSAVPNGVLGFSIYRDGNKCKIITYLLVSLTVLIMEITSFSLFSSVRAELHDRIILNENEAKQTSNDTDMSMNSTTVFITKCCGTTRIADINSTYDLQLMDCCFDNQCSHTTIYKDCSSNILAAVDKHTNQFIGVGVIYILLQIIGVVVLYFTICKEGNCLKELKRTVFGKKKLTKDSIPRTSAGNRLNDESALPSPQGEHTPSTISSVTNSRLYHPRYILQNRTIGVNNNHQRNYGHEMKKLDPKKLEAEKQPARPVHVSIQKPPLTRYNTNENRASFPSNLTDKIEKCILEEETFHLHKSTRFMFEKNDGVSNPRLVTGNGLNVDGEGTEVDKKLQLKENVNFSFSNITNDTGSVTSQLFISTNSEQDDIDTISGESYGLSEPETFSDYDSSSIFKNNLNVLQSSLHDSSSIKEDSDSPENDWLVSDMDSNISIPKMAIQPAQITALNEESGIQGLVNCDLKTGNTDNDEMITGTIPVKIFGENENLINVPKFWSVDRIATEVKHMLGMDQTRKVDLFWSDRILPWDGYLNDYLNDEPLYIVRRNENRSVPEGYNTDDEDVTDPFEKEDFRTRMDCGHAITPENLYRYCWAKLKDGFTDITCPSTDNCRQTWKYTEICKKACLSRDEESLFETMLSNNWRKNKKNVYTCPKCGLFILSWSAAIGYFECFDYCHQKYCVRCRQPWSNTSTCTNEECVRGLKQLQHQLQSCDRLTIIGVPNCPIIRACPNCKILIQFEGNACKHMLCSSCQTEFCFICLRIKIDKNYWPCGGAFEKCTLADVQKV